MHELPVTENLLEIALRHAEAQGATKINKLYIVIGQLTSIIDDSVQFYWDIISKGTIAEGAILDFKRIQTQFQCSTCGNVFLPKDDNFSCISCGGSQINIIAGKEFYLEAIDIESNH